MPGTRASSAQVTAKVQAVVNATGPIKSEHQAAVESLESRRKAIEQAREERENATEQPPFTEHEAALALLDLHRQATRELQQQENRTPAELAEASQNSHPQRSESPEVEYLYTSHAPIVISDSGDDTEDDNIEMTTEDGSDEDATPASETIRTSTDGDVPRIPAPTSAVRSPVSEGNLSDDSELTEIIFSGLTPPTSPMAQGGQYIQPAGFSQQPARSSQAVQGGQSVEPEPLSEQRKKLKLLARGEEGYDGAEPLEQWEQFSLAKAVDERNERARQQKEEYEEDRAVWEKEYALSDPILEIPGTDSDDSDFTEDDESEDEENEDEESDYEVKDLKENQSRRSSLRSRKMSAEE